MLIQLRASDLLALLHLSGSLCGVFCLFSSLQCQLCRLFFFSLSGDRMAPVCVSECAVAVAVSQSVRAQYITCCVFLPTRHSLSLFSVVAVCVCVFSLTTNSSVLLLRWPLSRRRIRQKSSRERKSTELSGRLLLLLLICMQIIDDRTTKLRRKRSGCCCCCST